MNVDGLIALALVIPFAGAALIPLAHAVPNVRETVTLTTATALFATVVLLLLEVWGGARPSLDVIQVTPGLEIAFRVEPLGMMFATIASTLWIVNSVYSIGYMRGNNEPRQTSFYVCFAIALAATMGIAFSANLFTLFLFYEILSISTYPLVAHKGNEEAKRGARVYLMMLIGASLVFFLPAIVWTYVLAGTLDFTPGGILQGNVGPVATGLLLALFAFGIGKAAVMPLHYWLPTAMVAPTPVSALLHAVAVVKAGVFTVSKVIFYIFGLDFLSETGASEWLIILSSFGLLMASLVAMQKDNLKARLAYSTVSQLAYVVLGAALATSTAMLGAGLHIAMHAAGKITLFFCAGAIYTATKKTEVSQLDGVGWRMPFTMFAFFLGALSVIGVPPLGGIWSKWHLIEGAYEAEHIFVVAVLMISTLLNIAYLLPPVIRAFLLPPKDGYEGGIKEAPLPSVLALSITALFCVILFFNAEAVATLLGGMFVN
jgi:multicomponent Na+:H+ antiporter subunit D